MANKPGKATKPLHLPNKAPRCFDSQEEWNTYRRLAQVSAGDGFTFCSDCTPKYQLKMKQQGRCQFPGTSFRTSGVVIIGRREK